MINKKIWRLATAIVIAEGWLPEKPSISFRNHNPGALRSSPFQIGDRNNFAYFFTDDIGFFALMWDIAKKCRGETRTSLNPESTLGDLVAIYSAEEDPVKLSNYIQIVENTTGKLRDTKLQYFID